MRVPIAVLVLALLVGLQPAKAQSPTRNTDGKITQQELLTGVISEVERRTIGRYYQGDRYRDERYRDRDYGYGYDDDDDDQGHSKKKGKKAKGKGKKKGLPPGLAKRDSLPPGLQKQLDERGALPPGLAKRDLPYDLRSELPRRSHEEFLIVDDDVVLVERATGVVLDVLDGILRGN